MNFTIIGDTVNLGSRLEGLNKTYQSEILISEHTYQRAKEQIVARPLDWVSVKGRTAPVLVYELLGMRSQLPPASLKFVERYGEALNDYRSRRWSDCIEQLEEILRLCDDDWPATVLKGRCYEYLTDPPPADWDGVLHLTEK